MALTRLFLLGLGSPNHIRGLIVFQRIFHLIMRHSFTVRSRSNHLLTAATTGLLPEGSLPRAALSFAAILICNFICRQSGISSNFMLLGLMLMESLFPEHPVSQSASMKKLPGGRQMRKWM